MHLPNVPAYTFKQSTIRQKTEISPGPGAYFFREATPPPRIKGGVIGTSNLYRGGRKSSVSPGPGAYEASKTNSKGTAVPLSAKKAPVKIESPGPGAYNPYMGMPNVARFNYPGIETRKIKPAGVN